MVPPKISSLQQRKIEVLVAKWTGKLTWDAIVQKIALEIGLVTTRQTLCTYTGIYTSYKKRKAELRGATPSLYTKITASDVKLVEQVDSLKAQVKVLERSNAEQLRMIDRMLSNASAMPGVDLNALIRRRSEEMHNA